MKLKPFVEEEEPIVKEDEADSTIIAESIKAAFSQNGFIPAKNGKLDIEEVRKVFNDSGASIENIAKVTGRLMQPSNDENTQLSAANLATRVHGILSNMENQIPVINIIIEGDGSTSLEDLFCPKS